MRRKERKEELERGIMKIGKKGGGGNNTKEEIMKVQEREGRKMRKYENRGER